MNPPIAIPEKFCRKIVYDKEKCIGYTLCLTVCPSETIVFKDEEKKSRFI